MRIRNFEDRKTKAGHAIYPTDLHQFDQLNIAGMS